MTTLVTGDDVAVPVKLKKDGLTFNIPLTATIQAAIVSADHSQTLAGPVAVLSSAAGSDWANSLVVAKFTSAQTDGILEYKPALLEVEVNDNGRQTWFGDVRIVKGQIA